MHISQRLQATKAGRSPGNDGTFNPTVFKYFTGWLGRSESLYLCSLKVHTFKNFSPRFARCSMTSTLKICLLHPCEASSDVRSCYNESVTVLIRICRNNVSLIWETECVANTFLPSCII